MHYDSDKQRQDQIVSFTDISLAYVCHIFVIRINHTHAFAITAQCQKRSFLFPKVQLSFYSF